MIVYRTGHYIGLIEEIEVEKVSDKTVYFKNGIVTRKNSAYRNYFETKQEAKEYLEAEYKVSISRLESQIQNLKNKLKELDKY